MKGLERVGELETKIAELENQILELEKEKGYLMLHKTEYEENILKLQQRFDSKVLECSTEFEALKSEYEDTMENCEKLSREIQKLNVEKTEAVREVEKKLAEKEAYVDEAHNTITELTKNHG